jgi:hypothetical protein
MSNVQRAVINAPQVIGEVIDGEAIIVNLENGYYYSLDKVGGDIWLCIERKAALPAIVEAVAGRYRADPSTVEADVGRLVDELIKEGLVTLDTVNHDEAVSIELGEAGESPVAYTTPALQKYVDMQDLLLLDPIHEVDELGWPNVKPDAS